MIDGSPRFFALQGFKDASGRFHFDLFPNFSYGGTEMRGKDGSVSLGQETD